MERKIITTADGSKTIYLPEWEEQYHSKHGAVQEAYHVFIKMGLHFQIEKNVAPLHILEVGFGTGLNALVTFLELKKQPIKVFYTAVEAFPVSKEEVEALNYGQSIGEMEDKSIFDLLHDSQWEQEVKISEFFHLKKQQKTFQEIAEVGAYNLVFYDAFGPRVQPELWAEEIFNKIFTALKPGGVLVTYCAQGQARRALQAVGFDVERLQGPPGKREMLRAVKRE